MEVTRDVIRGTNMITMGNRYGDAFVIYPHIARAIRGEEKYKVTPESALNLSTRSDVFPLAGGPSTRMCDVGCSITRRDTSIKESPMA